MTGNPVAVTAEQHKNTKIRRDVGFGYAEKVHVVPIVMNEFADVASNCPIIFVKEENGDRLRVAAMMGLDVEKNLLVQDGEWVGTHVPMNLGRVPFSFVPIGDGKALGTAVDMDSDLVSETEGEPLFNDAGEPTDYLKNVNQFLGNLFNGEIATKRFTDALSETDLLREFKLQMTGEDGTRRELVGLYTVEPKLLQELPQETVLDFHKEGILAGLHIAIQSMSQVKRLVRLHNALGENRISSVHLEILNGDQTVVTS